MGLYMRATGRMANNTDMEECFLTVMFMMASGKTDAHTVKELTFMKMEPSMLVTGSTTSNMVLEKKHGRMALTTRATMSKDKSTAREQ